MLLPCCLPLKVSALQRQLSGLSRREHAEEEDVQGLQTLNRELITEVEWLRTQHGEVS